jgi:hypothetical protein
MKLIPKSISLHIILAGLTSIALIVFLFLDVTSNQCRATRESNIVYDSYLATTNAAHFNSLWALQFLKQQNLNLNSPHGSFMDTASVTAYMAQDAYNRFATALNDTSCNAWDYWKIIIILVALLAQAIDVFILLIHHSKQE